MARKRKRRTINWKPVLGALLAANLLAGLFLSPLTAVRRLRIVGAPGYDQARLRNIALGLNGVPFGLVRSRTITSQAASTSEVRAATLRRNLFGRAVLDMRYRRPVAAIAGLKGAFLDDEGVPFRSRGKHPNLRKLHLASKFVTPGLSLAAAWPTRSVAEACRKLEPRNELKGYAIRLDATGRLWLNREGSGQVALGGAEALDEKIRKLSQLISERPNLLTRIKSLNLTDPARPALVPLAREGLR